MDKFDSIEHDSSTIRKSWFNHLTSELNIEFVNGSVYVYHDVDEGIWEKFVTEIPTGRAFNDHIKGKFEFKKLDD